MTSIRELISTTRSSASASPKLINAPRTSHPLVTAVRRGLTGELPWVSTAAPPEMARGKPSTWRSTTRKIPTSGSRCRGCDEIARYRAASPPGTRRPRGDLALDGGLRRWVSHAGPHDAQLDRINNHGLFDQR